ncbi:hypothetical protein Ga0466249_004877 [Sporomusaceae bacterium BoRhaA]|nr:hypothetical protein [Pelorhabdus rhamnosifermentans]
MQNGATRNQLNGWLDGRGEPDSEMMKIVAKRSGVNTAWLLGETNICTPIEKLVDHHTDNSLQDLPPETLERLEEFKELIRLKYAKKPAYR